jgi:hypothetical protein
MVFALLMIVAWRNWCLAKVTETDARPCPIRIISSSSRDLLTGKYSQSSDGQACPAMVILG